MVTLDEYEVFLKRLILHDWRWKERYQSKHFRSFYEAKELTIQRDAKSDPLLWEAYEIYMRWIWDRDIKNRAQEALEQMNRDLDLLKARIKTLNLLNS